MYNYKDKVVLITGGANGIGKCFAENFTKEGAKLALVDINEENLEKVKKELALPEDHVLIVKADVSKEEEIIKYVKAVKDKYGQIDVFCNNAGMTRNELIKETDIETLKKVWSVNLLGAYLGMKHVIPVMEEAKSGVIINTGSVDCYSAAPKNAIYCASKYALLGMTRCAALEEAPYNIRVNAICPGPINTGLMRDFEKRMNPDDPNAIVESFSSQIPLGRYADPQDIADLVLFLASDKASYITGSHYVIDGGWTHH